jgi:hypothetical protein
VRDARTQRRKGCGVVNRPQDVLKVDADEEGVGGDDAADALRYLVATKPKVPGAAVV